MTLHSRSSDARTSAHSRSRLRTTAVAAGVAAMLVGAAACSSGSGGSTSGGATLWGLTGTDQDNVLAPSLAAWNKANPNDLVKATYFANDAYKTKICLLYTSDAADE